MYFPHVDQATLRLLVSSLRLAPSGLALRFAPGETVLRSGGKPGPGSGPAWRAEDATRPPFARDGFFTTSQPPLDALTRLGARCGGTDERDDSREAFQVNPFVTVFTSITGVGGKHRARRHACSLRWHERYEVAKPRLRPCRFRQACAGTGSRVTGGGANRLADLRARSSNDWPAICPIESQAVSHAEVPRGVGLHI